MSEDWAHVNGNRPCMLQWRFSFTFPAHLKWAPGWSLLTAGITHYARGRIPIKNNSSRVLKIDSQWRCQQSWRRASEQRATGIHAPRSKRSDLCFIGAPNSCHNLASYGRQIVRNKIPFRLVIMTHQTCCIMPILCSAGLRRKARLSPPDRCVCTQSPNARQHPLSDVIHKLVMLYVMLCYVVVWFVMLCQLK